MTHQTLELAHDANTSLHCYKPGRMLFLDTFNTTHSIIRTWLTCVSSQSQPCHHGMMVPAQPAVGAVPHWQ
jgi:hypothetical protein